jgi:hypothetical protein
MRLAGRIGKEAAMNLIDKYTVEFDPALRIVHLGASELMQFDAPEKLEPWFAALAKILDRFIADGRVYLIIDMGNILFDPSLADVYARHVRAILEKYIYPGGIARYGFQITRVTVRRGYSDHLKETPHIFNTRAEAEAYIKALIEKNCSGLNKTNIAASINPDGSSDR